jgi:hypothetical protein
VRGGVAGSVGASYDLAEIVDAFGKPIPPTNMPSLMPRTSPGHIFVESRRHDDWRHDRLACRTFCGLVIHADRSINAPERVTNLDMPNCVRFDGDPRGAGTQVAKMECCGLRIRRDGATKCTAQFAANRWANPPSPPAGPVGSGRGMSKRFRAPRRRARM